MFTRTRCVDSYYRLKDPSPYETQKSLRRNLQPQLDRYMRIEKPADAVSVNLLRDAANRSLNENYDDYF